MCGRDQRTKIAKIIPEQLKALEKIEEKKREERKTRRILRNKRQK